MYCLAFVFRAWVIVGGYCGDVVKCGFCFLGVGRERGGGVVLLFCLKGFWDGVVDYLDLKGLRGVRVFFFC